MNVALLTGTRPARTDLDRGLIVLSGPPGVELGRVYRLGAFDQVIGRDAGAQIVIDDQSISRVHARIETTPSGAWELVDAGSTNGTFVNGTSVKRHLLAERDCIQVGSHTLLRVSRLDRPAEGEQPELPAAAIFDLAVSTQLVTWSPPVDRALGLPAGALSSQRVELLKLVHPEDRSAVRDALSHSKLAGVELEFRLEVSPAVQRWVACRCDVLRNEAGAAIRIIGTVSDLTDRKRNEHELRRQALIFESLYDGAVIMDVAGAIIDFNASASRMFGYARGEVLGKVFCELLRPGDAASLRGAIQAAIASDGRWTAEVELVCRSGQPIACESVIVPLKDPAGKTIGLIGLNRDVSVRKQLQARLLLNDRLASLGALAGGAAHEINNPLALIKANLAFLGEELERLGLGPGAPSGALDELQGILRESQQGVSRITTIVRDLKTFSHQPADEAAGPVDVVQVLETACSMTQTVVRRRAQLVKHLESGAFLVSAIGSRLCQVFVNLLINAADSIPDGRVSQNEIAVRVLAAGPAAVAIEVSDTGAGMSPEVQARVFDPFFTTRPIGTGTGLGLSTCHGIVHALGGTISVKSELGRGTTVRVVLPIATAPL